MKAQPGLGYLIFRPRIPVVRVSQNLLYRGYVIPDKMHNLNFAYDMRHEITECRNRSENFTFCFSCWQGQPDHPRILSFIY